MRRVVAIGVLALAVVLVPLVAAAAPAGVVPGAVTGTEQTESDGVAAAQSENFTAGERIGASIAAEQAEFEGEIGERSLEAALSRAADENETADVVRDRVERIETQLDELRERERNVSERYEAGEIDRGAYASSVAQIEAERRSLERQLNRSADVARNLSDPGAAADRGVNVSAIERLRQNASELGGQETREVARSIAGPNVGNGVGPDERGPPEHAGPPDRNDSDAGPPNATDSDRGPPEDAGTPGDGGPPEGDAGPPDDVNASDDVSNETEGPDDDNGPPEDEPGGAEGVGQSDDAGPPEHANVSDDVSNETEGSDGDGTEDDGQESEGTSDAANDTADRPIDDVPDGDPPSDDANATGGQPAAGAGNDDGAGGVDDGEADDSVEDEDADGAETDG